MNVDLFVINRIVFAFRAGFCLVRLQLFESTNNVLACAMWTFQYCASFFSGIFLDWIHCWRHFSIGYILDELSYDGPWTKRQSSPLSRVGVHHLSSDTFFSSIVNICVVSRDPFRSIQPVLVATPTWLLWGCRAVLCRIQVKPKIRGGCTCIRWTTREAIALKMLQGFLTTRCVYTSHVH